MLNQENKGYPFGQEIVWQPRPEWIEKSNLQRFLNRWQLNDLESLQQRVEGDIGWFWKAVLEELQIEFYEPYKQIVDFSSGIEFPQWCVGGKMNIAHNALDKWQNSAIADKPALLWEKENGEHGRMTYRQLFRESNRFANALIRHGFKKGDVIALQAPMRPELLVAFWGIIKIGGVVLPLFSGYGSAAVLNRLEDAEAKGMVVAEGLTRRGRFIPVKKEVESAILRCQSLQTVVVIPHADGPTEGGTDKKYIPWDSFLADASDQFETEKTAAEDLLMLIYTSGTTGRPKGAVHTHCGFPVKAAQDLFHSMDLKQEDTLFWFSDLGWMMGPWQIFGAQLIGATQVFYDGVPDYPHPGRLWELVEKHRITHLGVSPTLVRVLKQSGAEPVRQYDRSSLRMVGSTGSPWDPESWIWLFETVLDSQKPILNYSGGTEISGGILCGNFFKPLKPGAFSGPVPGVIADVVDENGEPLRGNVGELVIRQPWIGMTRGFWRDRDRYLESYWRKIPGLWVHGDYAAIDEDGLWYILGRSDDTLKIAGKRLGPAEVEAVVNAHPAVAESAAIGIPHPVKDNELVVFCVPAGHSPVPGLEREISEFLTTQLGKPLKPGAVYQVAALPKTRNAKILRRLIRAVYLGEESGDISSLENPESLQEIRELGNSFKNSKGKSHE